MSHASGAIELGARSVSGLVGVASRVTRSRRRVRPAEWERGLVSLRYRIWDSAPGPERTDALAVYCAHAASARRVIGGRRAAGARARVAAVLRLEQRLLDSRHLRGREREIAIRAVTRSLADVEGGPIP